MPTPQQALYGDKGPSTQLGNQPPEPEAEPEGEAGPTPEGMLDDALAGIKGLSAGQRDAVEQAVMTLLQDKNFMQMLSGSGNGQAGDQGGPGPAQ